MKRLLVLLLFAAPVFGQSLAGPPAYNFSTSTTQFPNTRSQTAPTEGVWQQDPDFPSGATPGCPTPAFSGTYGSCYVVIGPNMMAAVHAYDIAHGVSPAPVNASIQGAADSGIMVMSLDNTVMVMPYSSGTRFAWVGYNPTTSAFSLVSDNNPSVTNCTGGGGLPVASKVLAHAFFCTAAAKPTVVEYDPIANTTTTLHDWTAGGDNFPSGLPAGSIGGWDSVPDLFGQGIDFAICGAGGFAGEMENSWSLLLCYQPFTNGTGWYNVKTGDANGNGLWCSNPPGCTIGWPSCTNCTGIATGGNTPPNGIHGVQTCYDENNIAYILPSIDSLNPGSVVFQLGTTTATVANAQLDNGHRACVDGYTVALSNGPARIYAAAMSSIATIAPGFPINRIQTNGGTDQHNGGYTRFRNIGQWASNPYLLVSAGLTSIDLPVGGTTTAHCSNSVCFPPAEIQNAPTQVTLVCNPAATCPYNNQNVTITGGTAGNSFTFPTTNTVSWGAASAIPNTCLNPLYPGWNEVGMITFPSGIQSRVGRNGNDSCINYGRQTPPGAGAQFYFEISGNVWPGGLGYCTNTTYYNQYGLDNNGNQRSVMECWQFSPLAATPPPTARYGGNIIF